MNAGLILRVASERRDAQNERDRAGLCSSVAAATPSQQQLRRSSVAAALQPSTQLVVFVASLLEVLRRLEGGRDLRAA